MVRVILKLSPLLPKPEGVAKTSAAALTIVIVFPPAAARLSVCPFITVDAFEKFTVPKLDNGSTWRKPVGASSIHSAEDKEES